MSVVPFWWVISPVPANVTKNFEAEGVLTIMKPTCSVSTVSEDLIKQDLGVVRLRRGELGFTLCQPNFSILFDNETGSVNRLSDERNKLIHSLSFQFQHTTTSAPPFGLPC